MILNYSSYSHACYNGMIKQNMTSLAINLFLFIIESPYNVKTKKGKPYKISSKTASDWFYGYTNIYENLIKVIQDTVKAKFNVNLEREVKIIGDN